MKIAILHGARDLRIEDQDLDASNLGPHDIWVRTEITGLKIGTDRGNYQGVESLPGAPNKFPRQVGDSSVGIVQKVGSEVERVRVGDRVHTRSYHQSEFITDDSASIVQVPEGVDIENAVWGHLYTLSSLCYRKAFFQPGENVAVVGLGVLGLGAVAVGPLYGARVVGLGNSPIRLEMAMSMGANAAYLSDDPDLHAKLDSFSDGHGIDLVILTANPWPAYRTALEIVRKNGRVSIVSLLGRGEPDLDFNPLHLGLFFNKGISLVSVNGDAGYLFPTPEGGLFEWDRACGHLMSLMAQGRLEPRRLITHRLHYSEMKRAYDMAYEREKSMMLVTFDWRDA